MRAVLASAAPDAAKVVKEAPRTAAANIPRQTRADRKSAEKAIDRADVVMFPCFLAAPWWRQPICQTIRFYGSSLPIPLGSAISPAFIARLIKGCRGDAHAGCLTSEITEHFQRSNEHFSRESPPLGRVFSAATGEPNAQAEDQEADSSASRHPRAVQDRRRQHQEIFLAERLIAFKRAISKSGTRFCVRS